MPLTAGMTCLVTMSTYTADDDFSGADRIVSELAVIDVTPKGLKLIERAPGVSVEEIIKATEAKLIVEGEIPEMKL
jgi:acyl CoA:acetate/3-ketoacid CoA transferase beta subunit